MTYSPAYDDTQSFLAPSCTIAGTQHINSIDNIIIAVYKIYVNTFFKYLGQKNKKRGANAPLMVIS